MKDLKRSNNTITVRAYKFKEVASLYHVDPKTLRKWLKPFREEIGELSGHYFTIAQVEAIFQKLGLPYAIEQD
jgi:hypothetical protein